MKNEKISSSHNIFKKVWCRLFQKVFKLAIPLMPYRKPDVIDSIRLVPETLRKEGCHSVVIVTDKSMLILGFMDRLKDILDKAGFRVFVFYGTDVNPTVKNIKEAYRIYKFNKCDSIVALGGGSSMDCAKALGVCAAYPDREISSFRGILKVRRKLPTLVAIPTTAGTGSETTLAAVIRDQKKKEKYAISSFPLIPKYAVLDPSLTVTLPPSITAATGMDALTHAVEAYIGGSTTEVTRRHALHAVSLIFGNLEKAWSDGQNLEARRNMLQAAFEAGYAFTVSYVGYVHAMAHALGGMYNIAHGVANAAILPVVLKAYGKAAEKKLAELAVAAGVATENTPLSEAAFAFISAVEEKNRTFGIKSEFKELRIADIPALSRMAEKEGNPLYPVPVIWSRGSLQKAFMRLLPENVRSETTSSYSVGDSSEKSA
ncbi:MAG: iron-containing alcohol dehydrogenase [Treponemataceae bacterium]|nr:iron-containing alcohol dehydrogenase [Treponemataceae bacterium]